MNSFTTTTPNFDNLLLQTLMGRLQLRPHNNPTLEDLLFNATEHFSDFDSDDDDSDPNSKTQLAKEESKLEKEIIRIILSGKTETLKPNSGQAVSIGEHHICVGFHEEKGSDYRVWEWHGHVMLFDEENGYSPEYIYGNYFERTVVGRELKEWHCGEVKEEVEESEEEEEEEEEKVGLRELIEGEDSVCARIVHRNVNKSSPRLG